MLRLAMIGTGGYAFELIKRIWMIPDKIELFAVSSNPARKRPGANLCREKGVEVYNSVDEMFDKIRGRCDVVYVPTPIQTHSSLTKQSLSAGFDVFLEKPPTATIQELDELIEYVDGYNTKVAVCFQYLYTFHQTLKLMFLRQNILPLLPYLLEFPQGSVLLMFPDIFLPNMCQKYFRD